MKKEFVFLLVVFAMSVLLRFYKLSTVPSGLYVDETAIGYNSYSLAQTGKDEYGKAFPLYFRSFGDYKMPLYIYLSVIPVKLFGLNAFSVRFLSAFSGSLTVIVVYFLVKSFFKNEKRLPLIVSLFFAILPWNVFLSRMALEMQLGLFFLLLALLFHQKAIENDQTILWLMSSTLYAFAAYSYHTEKFIAPIIFIFWSLLNYQRSIKERGIYRWKNFFLAVIFFIFLLWPQIRLSFSSGAKARINSLSYFRDRQSLPFKGRLLGEVRKWGAMYTAYFSPRNLFYNPDPDPQRSLPDLSVFYPWMVLPFIIGMYVFVKKENLIGKKLTIFLLLISPLPASLTTDPFSTFRAFPLSLPLCVLISFGILEITTKINGVVILLMGTLIFSSSLGLLWRSLFILLPNERFYDWKYGYKQLVNQINKVNPQKVLVDDSLGVSYSEILFFQNFDPALFQKETKIDLERYYQLTSWEREVRWDKYEVRSISWEKDIYEEKLIVASPLAISDSQTKEHFMIKSFVIIGPDKKPIFNGFLTQPELKKADDERKLREKNESGSY